MTDNEFLLQDRITKIQSVMKQYGQENFCISFSGGKDSSVLSALVDLAIPNNKIPRVYADTGIDWNMIREFVYEKQKHDDRIYIIKPSIPIKQMLESEGYPFKSKNHSAVLRMYRNNPDSKTVIKYRDQVYDFHGNQCPKKLRYQFSPDFNIKVSDRCCKRLKEEPLDEWQKEHGFLYTMIGLMREEGGRREGAKCLAFRNGKLRAFQPLAVVTKNWENWFIEEYDVDICDIYKEPYNFTRTGCKGCPFNPHLQKDLDIIAKFFPREREQCEIIWEPVYNEYRRIGYRLKGGI